MTNLTPGDKCDTLVDVFKRRMESLTTENQQLSKTRFFYELLSALESYGMSLPVWKSGEVTLLCMVHAIRTSMLEPNDVDLFLTMLQFWPSFRRVAEMGQWFESNVHINDKPEKRVISCFVEYSFLLFSDIVF